MLHYTILGFQVPADDDSESEDEIPKAKGKFIGPQIPSFLSQNSEGSLNSSDNDESETAQIIGPILPSSLKNSSDVEDNDVYGPMPPQTNIDYDVVNIIEKRAAHMKNKLENKACKFKIIDLKC